MRKVPAVLLKNKEYRLVATKINNASALSEHKHAVEWVIPLVENDSVTIKAEKCVVNLLGEESWVGCALNEAEYSLLREMVLKELGDVKTEKTILNETKSTQTTKLGQNVKVNKEE